MKLSVIMPCFNVSTFLGKALSSLVTQTFSNLEIICVDDGSTDETPQILSSFAKHDDRIRVISKVNTGYGDSVNLGLAESTGDYVAVLEPDDFIEPEMYEVLMKNAVLMDLDLSRCAFFDFCEGIDTQNVCRGMPVNRIYRPRDLQDRCAFLQPPAIWSAVYRKSWLDAHGIRFLPTPGASFQDISFAFKTNLLAERCFAVNCALYHYRSHPNNSVKAGGKVFAPAHEYQECLSFARRQGELDTLKAVFLDMEYASYKWNYLRIGADRRREFLEYWQREWRDLLKEGFRFGCLKHRMYAWCLLNASSVFKFYLDSKALHA